jgi:hypothetical protein
MTNPEINFLEDLRQGKREALVSFYDGLVHAKGDDDFWRYLNSLARHRGNEFQRLRDRVDARGFDWFIKQASAQLLVLFLLAAMSFSGCSGDMASQSPAVIPATLPQSVPTADIVGDDPEDGPDVVLPTPPTAEEIRTSLVEYIHKAQLPAREKRRMIRTVGRLSRSKLVDAEADLASLFHKSSPKEIADTLEAMVILKKKERKWSPVMGRLYKGADFG